MKYNLTENSSLLLINNLRLKKKSDYFKKLRSFTLKLGNTSVKSQEYKKNFVSKKKGCFIVYSICVTFSALNTFLHVVDSSGNLKFSFSSGSLGFKGKSKKSRFQVLKLFFKELRKLRLILIKNQPVSVHLKNVSFYKRLLIRNLKKILFVKVVKNYQNYSYNGCRKKKKLRK